MDKPIFCETSLPIFKVQSYKITFDFTNKGKIKIFPGRPVKSAYIIGENGNKLIQFPTSEVTFECE